MNHLSKAHASTKLMDKNTVVDTVDNDSRPGVANMSSTNMELSEQLQLDFSAPASQKLVTQTELNAVIDRYIVENMLLFSTADSVPSEHSLAKILRRAGAGPPCRNTFSKYMDTE